MTMMVGQCFGVVAWWCGVQQCGLCVLCELCMCLPADWCRSEPACLTHARDTHMHTFTPAHTRACARVPCAGYYDEEDDEEEEFDPSSPYAYGARDHTMSTFMAVPEEDEREPRHGSTHANISIYL